MVRKKFYEGGNKTETVLNFPEVLHFNLFQPINCAAQLLDCQLRDFRMDLAYINKLLVPSS